MHDNDNLTIERPTFVTHLECAMEGDHYAADQVHNLSKAGKPLLVRYDLAGVKKALTKDALAQRPGDMWRYRELLAGAQMQGHRLARRGHHAADPAAEARRQARRRRDHRQGRGTPADRLVQGARPRDGGVDGQGARHQAHGDADQRQCRRGARGLRDLLRHQDHDLLPGRHARGERQRDRASGRDRLSRQRLYRRLRQDRRRRQGEGRLVRHVHARRSRTASRARRRWAWSSPSSSAGTCPT